MTGMVRAGHWLRNLDLRRTLRECLTAEAVTFLLLWGVLWITGRSSLFRDPGTFWHIAQGNILLESGEFIQQDPFTITRAGAMWRSLQWLGEIPLALLYNWGGWDLVLWGTVTALAAFYTWIFARLHKAGLPAMLAGFVLAVVLAASAHHFHARPHLASIAGMAVVFAVLLDVDSGRKSLRHLAWLVPLFALWANTHGGALGGWGTVVLAAGGWLLLWLLRDFGPRALPKKFPLESPIHTRSQAGWAMAVPLVCGAAMLANPYGLDMPRQWLEILTMQLPEMIQEHRPPSLTDGATWMMLALAAAWLVAVKKSWPTCRITWLLVLPWLLLGMSRVRHTPLFAVIAALVLADICAANNWFAKWQTETESKESKHAPAQRFRGWVLPGLLILMAGLWSAAGPINAGSINAGDANLTGRWAQLDPQRWPVSLVEPLQQLAAQVEPRPLVVYNDLDFGGFVSFYVPSAQTFIDDRCELFGEALLQQYLDVERGVDLAPFDRWDAEYHFQAALTRPFSPLAAKLRKDPRWQLVAESPAAVLFHKQSP